MKQHLHSNKGYRASLRIVRRASRRINTFSEAEVVKLVRTSSFPTKAEPKYYFSNPFSKGMRHLLSNKARGTSRRINTLSEAEVAKILRASACEIAKARPRFPPSSQYSRNFRRRLSMEKTAPPIIALASTLEQQPKATNGIPILVEACLRYLNTNAIDCVGLFRVPGESNRVKQLWEYMDKHPFARLSMNCVDVFMRNHPEFTPHDVASFMKRAIKSMVGDEHVVTYDCYEPLVSLIRSKCPSDEIGAKCRRIIGQLLVPARRLLLGRLCNFLREFAEHHETTHMNCGNLAVCFAHLMQPSSDEKVDALDHLRSSKHDPGKWYLRFPRLFKNSKVKKPISVEQLHEFMVNEGQKAKLCISVIEVLIGESEKIFVNPLTPPRVQQETLGKSELAILCNQV